MEKGQILELTIDDMSVEGQGIGRSEDGFVVFVPGAVVGDKVRAKLTKVKKNYGNAVLEEIVTRSDARNDEVYCRICGGCPYSLLQYETQLAIKERQVRNRLERMAGITFGEEGDGLPVLRSIVGMDAEDNDGDGPWRYRNKAVMAVDYDKKTAVIGFRKAKSHDVTDCMDCLLQPLTAAAAADATRVFMQETKGWFKGMTVKTAFGTGQVMVVYDVVDKNVTERIMPKAERLVDLLDEAIYELGSYDDGEPAYTLESVALRWDKGVMTLAGSNTIIDEITLAEDDLTMNFEISPNSFYQVNTAQMQRLYGIVRNYCQTAMDASQEDGQKPVVLDLYCGVGTIGLCLADLAEQVIGIEVVREAVIDANRNAVINGIVNAIYICGKAEEEIAGLDIAGANTIAVLDPPRAGCKPELLETIAKAEVQHIIYVSCDPATLARDVKALAEMGYQLVEATPVDMFPQTGHVETVALIQKRKSN